MRIKLKALKRFIDYLDPTRDISVCWEWKGPRDRDGYGIFNLHVAGKCVLIRATHFTYSIDSRKPVPIGKQILHTCDNPPCCNPTHLYIGNHTQNMKDMALRNRAARLFGEQNPNSKLTEGDVKEIKVLLLQGSLNHNKIAKRYGVSKTRVDEISSGKAWQHVTVGRDDDE